MTRASSVSDNSLELCDSPKVADVRNENFESTLWCLDAPMSPDLGLIENWNLPQNNLEHVLIDFCIYSLSLAYQTSLITQRHQLALP